MQLDLRIRLALVIGGVSLIGLALAGSAWGKLDGGLVQQILSIAGGLLGGLLGGIGLAGGPSRPAGTVIVLLALGVSLSACSGAQHTPTPEDCQAERQVLNAIGAAVEATNIALPVDLEGRSEVIAYSREGIEIGAAAVEACESARDGAPWIRFVSVALKIIRGIVEVLRLVGLDIPGVVGQVLDLLVSADDAHHQPVASFDDTVWW